MTQHRSPSADKRNARTGMVLIAVVVGMVGLSFASVPLYRLFCQVTGYGGTPKIAAQSEDAEAPKQVAERRIVVRFNADVDPRLPWRFAPVQRAVEVAVGEQGIAFFRARNMSDRPIVGRATFNVTPLKAGPYFVKMQCFCFDEQRLEPGEEVDMPVTFYVDAGIMDDPNLDEVKTITLSYTFFRAVDDRDEDDRRARAQQAARRSAGPEKTDVSAGTVN
ncbi:MAG: cytochrome c oxidase assembly protein [Alphaproteobacteria bacterium]|nr:MAG: cytochrome c oxidase assembly protein [Alphaproteobacteria bacterium]